MRHDNDWILARRLRKTTMQKFFRELCCHPLKLWRDMRNVSMLMAHSVRVQDRFSYGPYCSEDIVGSVVQSTSDCPGSVIDYPILKHFFHMIFKIRFQYFPRSLLPRIRCQSWDLISSFVFEKFVCGKMHIIAFKILFLTNDTRHTRAVIKLHHPYRSI